MGPLVNQQAELKHFVTAFSTEGRYSYLAESVKKIQCKFPYTQLDEQFGTVRDKVCELMLSHALYRPLKMRTDEKLGGKQETRNCAITKATGFLNALEGKLPAKLAMLCAEARRA